MTIEDMIHKLNRAANHGFAIESHRKKICVKLSQLRHDGKTVYDYTFSSATLIEALTEAIDNLDAMELDCREWACKYFSKMLRNGDWRYYPGRLPKEEIQRVLDVNMGMAKRLRQKIAKRKPAELI